MIVSASYKTDIPTFYGSWFVNRLAAGYCKIVNPYNQSVYRVSLEKQDVDGFIFWTKNIGPFLSHLTDVKGKGFPFIVQYTINNYPRALETSVVDAEASVKHMYALSTNYGSSAVVWRYDTIMFSSLTPEKFHLENFERLASLLRGTTDEVVISFAQLYKKTLSNVKKASATKRFEWWDPSPEFKFDFASRLAEIARAYNIQLTMCSQKEFLAPGVENARCVDAERLSRVSGKSIDAKIKGNRPDCGCYMSRDIGDYDTCPHGCVYCYAVRSPQLALSRYRKHNPNSEFLFEPEWYDPSKESQLNANLQGKLF